MVLASIELGYSPARAWPKARHWNRFPPDFWRSQKYQHDFIHGLHRPKSYKFERTHVFENVCWNGYGSSMACKDEADNIKRMNLESQWILNFLTCCTWNEHPKLKHIAFGIELWFDFLRFNCFSHTGGSTWSARMCIPPDYMCTTGHYLTYNQVADIDISQYGCLPHII